MPSETPVSPAPLSLGQKALVSSIRGYQLLFAPIYAGSCRFVPSCSAYAIEAVTRFGVLKGGWLAVRRLARCHPFGGHGLDPVAGPSVLRRKPETSNL